MGVMDFLLGGGLSTLFGGVTGLIGSVITYKKERFAIEAEMADRADQRVHDVQIQGLELKAIQMEVDSNVRVTSIEAQQAMEASADRLMGTSLEAARLDIAKPGESWPMLVIEWLRRSVRPVLSYTLATAILVLTWWVKGQWDAMGLKMTGEQVFQMSMYMFTTLVYLGTTVICWWFGTRNKNADLLEQMNATEKTNNT